MNKQVIKTIKQNELSILSIIIALCTCNFSYPRKKPNLCLESKYNKMIPIFYILIPLFINTVNTKVLFRSVYSTLALVFRTKYLPSHKVHMLYVPFKIQKGGS